MSKASSHKGERKTPDKKEQMEAERRRNELCNMLLCKFQTKYPFLSKPVILKHVNQFLDTTPVTNENLNALEEQILAAAGRCKPKLEDKKGNGSAHIEDDRISIMSGATQYKNIRPGPKQFLESKMKTNKQDDVELDYREEEDEWAQILKFNHKLYQEEIKQAKRKKEREKRFMKCELERQLDEKKEIKNEEKAEAEGYLQYQKDSIKRQNEIEKKKQEEKKMEVTYERQLRDKQRKEDELRKRMEEAASKAQDKKMVERRK